MRRGTSARMPMPVLRSGRVRPVPLQARQILSVVFALNQGPRDAQQE